MSTNVSAATSEQPKVTLYWLNYSRSQRILWLLEELNIKYDLKVYERMANFRVPPELKEIHPLGKSPVIGVDGKIISESGLITQYLLSKFDHDNKLTPTNADDKLDMDYYLHYAEGTLQPNIVAIFVLASAKKRLPWGLQIIGSKIIDGILENFYFPELYLNLDFLESQLEGKTYFVGDKLTGADILLSFPVPSCFEGRLFKLNKEYPNIQKWIKTINSNKTKQKSDEIVKSYQH